MDLPALLDALARPGAYPHPVDRVELCQTHISAVFLAGPFAYKIKKPVNFGFLDFSTLERRRHFCHEEVRLNRRLAPEVYLGVVPVALDAGGLPAFEAPGEPVEFAVKMRRLDPALTLESRLECGTLSATEVRQLGSRLAAFHAHAERSPDTAAGGAFAAVAANTRENFTQLEAGIGRTLRRSVFDRIRARTEAELERLRPLIEARAARGVPCDTHGDLHLDHVYLDPSRSPPTDLTIVDCIEFNTRFRFADPIADLAFLAMDFVFHGRSDLASELSDAYFASSEDAEGRALLSFYLAYRAVVRGKVEGFALEEAEVSEAEKELDLARARAHFLLALGTLEPPAQRPALVLSAGLPGAGKSVLARMLAERAGFERVASDDVRKELAGLPPTQRGGPDLYSPAMSDRTYVEVLERVRTGLLEGKRMVADATFIRDVRREAFLNAARALCVPVRILICTAPDSVILPRLAARTGDSSDADADVYRQLKSQWQPGGPRTVKETRILDASDTPDATYAQAEPALREAGLI